MIRGLAFLLCTFGASAAFAAPPIQSPLQAVARLRAAKTPAQAKAAVEAVKAACSGKLRHALRDHAGLLSSARKLASAKAADTRKAALDLDRCFSPSKFSAVVAPRLTDEAPAVINYAAEVSARMAHPSMTAPLLAALAGRKPGCLAPGLGAADREVCVWLTYAPGATLEAADEATRRAAAQAAVEMFEAPYAKVREVAVETVASAKIAAHAKEIAALLKAEKAKKFPEAQEPALLRRFEKRRRALAE